MIEMPPLQFAQVNGIRMGYYEAGPSSDKPPVILCHGWPEIAFSWRHQIKALSEAGIRVIAPDQRGYGATDRPEPVEDYDMEHLTGDLVGLLDHLKIDKAIFVGHDWGGFIVWQMPLRHPSTRRRRRRRQHAALRSRCRPIRSSCFASASATRCTSCSSRIPAASRTGSSAAASSRPSMRSCASRCRARRDAGGTADRRCRRLAATQSGVSADDRGLRRQARSAHADPVAGREEGVRRYLHQDRLHRRHQLVSQLFAQLAALGRARSYSARAVADDHGRERRACCRHRPPTAWRRSSPIWRNIWCATAAIGRSRKSRRRSAPS